MVAICIAVCKYNIAIPNRQKNGAPPRRAKSKRVHASSFRQSVNGAKIEELEQLFAPLRIFVGTR